MARVSHAVSFVTAQSPTRCIEYIRRFLSDNGMETCGKIEEEIAGFQGSALYTSLIGGWLQGSAKLPMWIHVYCQGASNGDSSVILVLDEALADQEMDRQFRECYQRGLRELANGLRAILSRESDRETKSYIPAQSTVEPIAVRV